VHEISGLDLPRLIRRVEVERAARLEAEFTAKRRLGLLLDRQLELKPGNGNSAPSRFYLRHGLKVDTL